MNPKTGGITPYAGSGREGRRDGPLVEAALAQPSGITTDGKKLYFADSEVSSIRSADLDNRGNVETIVGEDLFEFGDRDGKGSDVRLQHPLGVVYYDGLLYVADTYNNKIKRVSPKAMTSETFAGTGEGDLRDGPRAAFDEPGGISAAMGKLYVADTNNHAIRVVDLKTKRVTTLQINGLEKLKPVARTNRFNGEVIEVPRQAVEPGPTTLTLQLELPGGYKLNALAPSAVTVTTSSDGSPKLFRNPRFPIDVPLILPEGQHHVTIDFNIYYCESEKDSLCYFKDARLKLPVDVKSGAAPGKLTATYKLQLAQEN
jgi:hypothetical protein